SHRPRTRRSSGAAAPPRSPDSTRLATTIRFWTTGSATTRGSGSGTWSRDSPESRRSALLPVEEILEALDLSRAQPGSGFLAALFARFNARVPFENASKIVRDAGISDPEEKARNPDLFWQEHLELGAGGTCFARVAAFGALLDALGFSTRRVLGRVER